MKPMDKKVRALWEVNIATVVLASNSLFVKLLSLSAEAILVFRAFLASAVLFILIYSTGGTMRLKNKRDYLYMLFLGILMGVNWLFFFYSVQVSTIAVSMLSIFTYPIMTVFLEPYFTNAKIDKMDILMAFTMFIGIIFLIPEFDLSNNITLGVLFGLASALGYALRNVFIKRWTTEYSSPVLMNYQLLVMAVLSLPLVFIVEGSMEFMGNDIWYLLYIAIVGSAFAHTLFVKSLSALKASTASVIGGAQPVYAILLAFFILAEVPDSKTLIGGAIIIVVATFENVRHVRG